MLGKYSIYGFAWVLQTSHLESTESTPVGRFPWSRSVVKHLQAASWTPKSNGSMTLTGGGSGQVEFLEGWGFSIHEKLKGTESQRTPKEVARAIRC